MKILDIINIPAGFILKICYNLFGNHNYLIALLLFSIIIEILLSPFGIKQQKNMIKQAKLRPKEMAIRKKYAGRNDQVTQRKVQEEIMNLYQQENFNPASGCLPLLIQFPILIALYNVVISPLRYICSLSASTITAIGERIITLPEYAGKTVAQIQQIEMIGVIREKGLEFFSDIEGFSIESLADLPKFTVFGNAFDISKVPTLTFKPFDLLMLIPILTFVFSLISTKLIRKFSYQPTANDDAANNMSTKIMEYSMPVLSAWIAFRVPATIGIYWIFKQLLGVVKQIILAKALPIPTFTEEDYKAAEKEMNVKSPKKKNSSNSSSDGKPKPRSLHHIDDEDFEDTKKAPEKVKTEPIYPAWEENESEKSSEPEKKTPFEKAPLKEDKKDNKDN